MNLCYAEALQAHATSAGNPYIFSFKITASDAFLMLLINYGSCGSSK
jgi:hypothetical protein